MPNYIKRLSVILFFLMPVMLSAQVTEIESKVFQFELKQNLPGTPEAIFDAISGDISPWWDHTFSENPVKLFIEPKPGGHFIEIFNEQGDGVIHATVTGAQRGKFLRLDGPLGLAGKAMHMVTTYHFSKAGMDSTQLKVDVHMAGEIDTKLAEVVKKVWYHFILEQFMPYVMAVNHKPGG